MKMKTYMLTVPANRERAVHTIAQLMAGGFNYQAVHGVDARHDPDWLSKVSVSKEGLSVLRNGEICCAQGHYRIMQRFMETGAPFCFIVEDDSDLICSHDFVETLAHELPLDWHVGMVSKTEVPGVVPEFYYPGHPHYYETDHWKRVRETEYGTHGYLLSRRGADYLLREGCPIFTPIDCMIKYRAWAVPTYHTKQPYVFVRQNTMSTLDRGLAIPERPADLLSLH